MKHTILYVDDEEKSLKYFERMLKSDFNILTASNVTDAREILDREHSNISLLLSDQRMPGEKGNVLLQYARNNYPTITRMLTTAFQNLDDAIESVNNGEILRYITKPWEHNSLKIEIQNGIRFFELKKERNLLIGEKLGIKLRGLAQDRVKAIVLLCTGLRNINQIPVCLAQYFADTQLDTGLPEFTSRSSDTMDAVIDEMDMLCRISTRLHEILEPVGSGNVAEIDVGTRLQELCQNSTTSLECSEKAMLTEDNITVQVMLEQLVEYLTGSCDSCSLRIMCSDSEIRISASGSVDKDRVLAENLMLHGLILYLLVYHLGGSIHLPENIRLMLEIKLPCKKGDGYARNPGNNWIITALEKYESW